MASTARLQRDPENAFERLPVELVERVFKAAGVNCGSYSLVSRQWRDFLGPQKHVWEDIRIGFSWHEAEFRDSDCDRAIAWLGQRTSKLRRLQLCHPPGPYESSCTSYVWSALFQKMAASHLEVLCTEEGYLYLTRESLSDIGQLTTLRALELTLPMPMGVFEVNSLSCLSRLEELFVKFWQIRISHFLPDFHGFAELRKLYLEDLTAAENLQLSFDYYAQAPPRLEALCIKGAAFVTMKASYLSTVSTLQLSGANWEAGCRLPPSLTQMVFTGISQRLNPSNFLQCSAVRHLEFHKHVLDFSSQIKDLQDMWSGMEQLEHLAFTQTSISLAFAESITGLTSLKVLRLTGSTWACEMKPGPYLSALEVLSLGCSKTIPKALRGAHQLRLLDAYEVAFVFDRTKAKALLSLPELRQVHLSGLTGNLDVLQAVARLNKRPRTLKIKLKSASACPCLQSPTISLSPCFKM